MLIRVTFCSIAELPNDLSAAIDALPFGEGEKVRLRGIKNKESLRHSLAALTALSKLCGTDVRTVVRDANGKPRFFGSDAPQFSLSHAGGVAVAALSDEPVGADLEAKRDSRKESAVAHRFFTDAERNDFLTHGDFSALWTKKEARAKCLGLPLASVLSKDLELFTRTYRTEHLTLSLAAEQDFEVEFFQTEFSFQEVNL